MLLLLGCQFTPFFYSMPFLQAPPAATASGMLSQKHRVASHWRLLAVIGYKGRCKPSGHKVASMMPNRGKPFLPYVIYILLLQVKFAAKRRCRQARKKLGISIWILSLIMLARLLFVRKQR